MLAGSGAPSIAMISAIVGGPAPAIAGRWLAGQPEPPLTSFADEPAERPRLLGHDVRFAGAARQRPRPAAGPAPGAPGAAGSWPCGPPSWHWPCPRRPRPTTPPAARRRPPRPTQPSPP